MASQLDQFIDFADYDVWANRRLYDAVEALPHAALRQTRSSAFFGSLLGVLNHLLVTDRIWMDRLEHLPPQGLHLDATLHEELGPLRAARQAEDERIRRFVTGLSEADLDRAVAYKNSAGTAYSDQLSRLLAHLFNHHTHHRGQAHALLSDAGVEPPPLDYLYYRREVERAA